MQKIRKILIDGATELGLALDEVAIDRLLAYRGFLKEYNKKVNLTSIVDDEEIIVKHFLDSMTVLPDINTGTKIIDIGTGAGFPGVVLKIAREDLDLVLVDSTRKKIVFLKELLEALVLKDVESIHARAEDLLRQRPDFSNGFDYAVSRAVARLSKLAEYCLPYVKVGGEFIAMKGRNYKEELDESRKTIKSLGGEISSVKEVTLPGSDIVHSIIRIKSKNSQKIG